MSYEVNLNGTTMLPGEPEFTSDSQSQLSRELTVCRPLLAIGVEVIEHRDYLVSDEELKNQIVAYRVGHGLCVKGCKSLRSSIMLASIGAGNDLSIVSRSMFETFVAASFVLRDHVPLGLNGVDDEELTADRRARLYSGCYSIKKHDELLKLLEDPAAAQILAHVDVAAVKMHADEAAADVGPDWTKRFRKRPYSYSGLTLRSLSEKLGTEFVAWYIKVYGEQSKSTHATDIGKHIRYAKDEERFLARWMSAASVISGLLVMNAMMLYGSLDLLNQRFRIGEGTTEELQAVLAELADLAS